MLPRSALHRLQCSSYRRRESFIPARARAFSLLSHGGCRMPDSTRLASCGRALSNMGPFPDQMLGTRQEADLDICEMEQAAPGGNLFMLS
jgi:hypothetical protein